MHFKIVHVEEEKEAIQPGLNNISEMFTPKSIVLRYNHPLVLLPAGSYKDTKGLSGSRDDLVQEAREIQHVQKILLSYTCENQSQGR